MATPEPADALITGATLAPIMELLQQAFPAWRPDEKTMMAWGAILSPYQARDVRAAALLLCRGKDGDSNPDFPPTTARLCVVAEECQRARSEADERARRAQTPALPAEGDETLAARCAVGESIRDRLAKGERFGAILKDIGKPMPAAPTDREVNDRRNRALDALEAKP